MTLLMMPNAEARRARYNREAVLSATPVRLLTMLYDRLLLDLNRAEAAQVDENWGVASENLLHAQAIISELTTSLNVDAWNGGEGLFALYTYVSTALMRANTHRDVARTQESIALLEPLRLTWHEAAASLPAQPAEVNTTGGALGFG
ncbi:flagellar protein FliS [Cryobacterium sp. MLB-32]|uniref:flagellar export chaperone FliS n=1 Tax=Cryobacterium sp. MLB-32 TaxID=1529318 RepID=UPI0004E60B3A|nr:flagellar export chaperone FliS [Cryobacterium sp. MLB-32]KFF61082.1 flagellar protein FliS [Cryobacterium sp. MLB-32]